MKVTVDESTIINLMQRVQQLEDYLFSENKALEIDYDETKIRKNILNSIKSGYCSPSQIKQRARKCSKGFRSADDINEGLFESLLQQMINSGDIVEVSSGRKFRYCLGGK